MPRAPILVPDALARAIDRAAPAMLATWFLIASVNWVLYYAREHLFGVDFFVYRGAAAAALSGGDPWATAWNGTRFAAPPPSLLPYLGLAMMPEPIALVLSVVATVGAAVFVTRRLGLPAWWLLFPPIVDSVIAQNPDVVVVALLVAGSWFATLGPVLKVYAAIPLLLQRRWRSLIVAAGLCLLSVPLMPAFLSHAGELGGLLQQQAGGGLSAWGTWLVIPTALALAALGPVTASWLVVPGLRPATQAHYACLALPALRQRWLLAAALAVSVPLIVPLAICATALWERWLGARIAGSPIAARDSLRVADLGSPRGHPGGGGA